MRVSVKLSEVGKKRRKKFGSGFYGAYLSSPQWFARRERVLKRDGYLCVDCGKIANHVHHLHYATLGRERLSDLVSLCGACHKARHENG